MPPSRQRVEGALKLAPDTVLTDAWGQTWTYKGLRRYVNKQTGEGYKKAVFYSHITKHIGLRSFKPKLTLTFMDTVLIHFPELGKK